MRTILLCIPTLASAGAERFVTELACGINREEYRVVVLVTKIYNTETAFWRKLNSEGIEIVDASESSYFKQIFKLRRIICTYKPSIIHTNVSAALYMILPLAISGVKARHLFTTHSMGYRIFAGVKKKLMGFCFKSGIVVPVAICDTVKKSLVDAYALPEEKIECVYNGVDTALFQREKIDHIRPFTFVSVGTLYHIKNHELLLNAFKQVVDYEKDVRLIIVGDGELRNKLEAQVKNLDIKDKVEFVGNQADVVPFLSSADVYCCSSTVEGLPISVLEAMACELPVITTPAGGVVDIVKDGINGFVVDATPNAMSDKMIFLINNCEMKEKMGLESRRMACTHNLKVCVREYEQLYEKYSK